MRCLYKEIWQFPSFLFVDNDDNVCISRTVISWIMRGISMDTHIVLSWGECETWMLKGRGWSFRHTKGQFSYISLQVWSTLPIGIIPPVRVHPPLLYQGRMQQSAISISVHGLFCYRHDDIFLVQLAPWFIRMVRGYIRAWPKKIQVSAAWQLNCNEYDFIAIR